ncbi:bifunctional AP-4-A phosphorylase/ADP sulfurylase [Coemansia sp. RSA 1807]|nr:bifunctional AP-4-A phosphorylase/ADP sulfurylase [Coemansia sp. RSA 921]KAJ2140278.1 bifunctional AP-4-A phosphorylase/ADP sulfurylase [Coemansia sp. RSA 564]KAJ2201583.1 bifunctional AP-4-A phosphorylase/ADP sulfurylase [Coemansia sp. RSA 522]KAJ2243450.1 bifunctional AP-4-A phosphorylase/ADP sulfurylase [Coemansia sp. RSA 454]KAJ2274405.1 bifunctional AP-4-A phosphorylase/ADP sulfurylase [Coemansia sp. RSA 451]KAJ2422110.1 bifunctional AP-4-A phosphorylase/ADP sulfurylase [Coemansia sp. 
MSGQIITKSLDRLVQQCYSRAVAQGALLFTESSVYKHREQGVVFEVRYVPALAKKPNSKPREKQHAKDFVNPFLPYDERLHVKQIGNTHHLLLNKYCVVPHHLLITTAEFRQQGEPLSEADFTAVLETIDNLSSRNIVFYNSGEESGASQPHKHLQVLPMPEYLDMPPSISLWLQSIPPVGAVHTSKQLPFAHFGVLFGDSPLLPSNVAAAYQAALSELTTKFGSECSYNMIMTRSAIMLFPRRQSSWNDIAINSLGFAGLVLAKTKDEQELLNRFGILHILSCVGYPRTQ